MLGTASFVAQTDLSSTNMQNSDNTNDAQTQNAGDDILKDILAEADFSSYQQNSMPMEMNFYDTVGGSSSPMIQRQVSNEQNAARVAIPTPAPIPSLPMFGGFAPTPPPTTLNPKELFNPTAGLTLPNGAPLMSQFNVAQYVQSQQAFTSALTQLHKLIETGQISLAPQPLFMPPDLGKNPFSSNIAAALSSVRAKRAALDNGATPGGPEKDQSDNTTSDDDQHAKKKRKDATIKEEDQLSVLERQLQSLLDSQGGLVDSERVGTFIKLMQQEKTEEGQSLLLTVILSTRSVLLKKLVDSCLVLLNDWLQQAKQDNKVAVARLLLKVLEHLPITLKALRASTLGKTVNKLKMKDKECNERANKLIDSWKTLVDAAIKDKEPKEKEKPKTATVPFPEPAKFTMTNREKPPTTEEVTKKKKVDQKSQPKEKDQPSSGAQQKAPEPRQIVMTASDDFDSLLDKKEAKAPTRVLAKGKSHKMKLLEDPNVTSDVLKRLSSKTTAQPMKSKPLSADDIRKEKFKKKIGVDTTPSSAGSPVMQTTTTVSTPTETSQDSPITPSSPPISSPSSSQPKKSILINPRTQRNLSALRSALDDTPVNNKPPSPPALDASGENKEQPEGPPRKRRISWAPDDKLTQVKLFTVEPVEIAPSVQEEEMRMKTELEHGNFHKAQQLEHENERKFLEQQRTSMKAAVDSVVATVAWRTPPAIDIAPEFIRKQGEQSTEAEIERKRQETELMAVYHREALIPPSPAEPVNLPKDYDDSKTLIVPFDEPFRPQQQQAFQTPNMYQQAPAMGYNPYGAPMQQPPVAGAAAQYAAGVLAGATPDPNQLLSLLNSPELLRQLQTAVSAPGTGNYNPAAAAALNDISKLLMTVAPGQMGVPPSQGMPPHMGGPMSNQNAAPNPMGGMPQYPGPMGGPAKPPNNMPYPPANNPYPPYNYENKNFTDSNFGRNDVYDGSSTGSKNNFAANQMANHAATKLCSFFNTPQGCRNGSNCTFIHDVNSNPGNQNFRGGGGNGGWRQGPRGRR